MNAGCQFVSSGDIQNVRWNCREIYGTRYDHADTPNCSGDLSLIRAAQPDGVKKLGI